MWNLFVKWNIRAFMKWKNSFQIHFPCNNLDVKHGSDFSLDCYVSLIKAPLWASVGQSIKINDINIPNKWIITYRCWSHINPDRWFPIDCSNLLHLVTDRVAYIAVRHLQTNIEWTKLKVDYLRSRRAHPDCWSRDCHSLWTVKMNGYNIDVTSFRIQLIWSSSVTRMVLWIYFGLYPVSYQ